MRKRIIIFCTLLTIAALVISGILSMLAVQQRYLKEARAYLQGALDLTLSYAPDESDFKTLAREKAAAFGNHVRITLIGVDGKVLGDSEGDTANMPNHLDRAEVKEALANGTGEEIRYSDTLKKDMLYIAEKHNNVVIRFAMPLENEQIFLSSVLPSVLIAGVLALFVAVIAVNLLMKQILKPFYAFQAAFNKILKGDLIDRPKTGFAELTPVVEGMNNITERLNHYIQSLRQQTEKIDNIIRHMQEGLVLLDEHAQVLLSNVSARKLLNIESDLDTKNFPHLVRNKEILIAVTRAITEKKPSVLDLKKPHDTRYLRIFISPVQNGGGAIMLLSDISEIKRAENMRSEFTANVSHELKTPLTTIKGFAELIAEGMVRDPAAASKYAALIKIEAERLINLINDILRISELEETQIPVNLEAVDLYDAAKGIEELLQTETQKRGVTVNVQGEHVIIRAARDSIKELILNIVDNAVKYNKKNGDVRIEIRRFNNFAAIIVEDTGIGIPKEHQERIFERFYRVDKGRSKKTGGTGLGLSIVKHIAGLYHAEIKLKSEPQKGTRFEILFPMESKGD